MSVNLHNSHPRSSYITISYRIVIPTRTGAENLIYNSEIGRRMCVRPLGYSTYIDADPYWKSQGPERSGTLNPRG